MTKQQQVERLQRLIKINNQLYADFAISERNWKNNSKELDKQRINQNITLEELEQISEPYCGDCLVPISQCGHKVGAK